MGGEQTRSIEQLLFEKAPMKSLHPTAALPIEQIQVGHFFPIPQYNKQ
jgi:hypothetical protein